MSVSWSTDREKPGYVVRFNDIVLKKNIAEIDKAKAAALKLARTVLTRSLAALGDA